MHPLISVAELTENLEQVTVLDVRYSMKPGRDDFLAGHVPGAQYVDLDSMLAAAPGSAGRHPLPDPETFAAAMRSVGVGSQRPVVVYDDWGSRAAARCWWLLRWAGKSDVRVLDGGWAAWRRASGSSVAGEADAATPGDFVAAVGQMPVLAKEEVLAFDGVLLDARAPQRFAGEVEPIDPVAGHIPGAVNFPTEWNLNDDGTFRTPEELRTRYAEVGVRPGAKVAAYCGSGVTACHNVLALASAEIDATLYAGSWSEWVYLGDDSTPA